MTDLVERSDEPVIFSSTEITGRKSIKMDIKQGYVAPLDGREDLHDVFDMKVAHDVADILVKKYFGYPWMVEADCQQGLVKFKLPELMGPTLWYVINLARYSDLTPELVTRCGGELLERMGLSRGLVDMAQMQFARDNKHTFDFGDVKQ